MATRWVIRIVSLAGVVGVRKNGLEGQYVKFYNPEDNDGWGSVESTSHIEEALTFNSSEDAVRTWRAVPEKRPLRPDGKPNRPLTAFTVEIIQVP